MAMVVMVMMTIAAMVTLAMSVMVVMTIMAMVDVTNDGDNEGDRRAC
jgi:hypothetical protein